MPSATPDEFSLVGHRIEDRYDIERVVAAGGFGVVYFGHHRALRNAIAVKVLRIPPRLTEAEQHDFAQRFLAEAQTLAQLQHPAVVRAQDFGVSPMPNGVTAPWTVLEWVEGETLKDFLDRRRGVTMAPQQALAMLRPVLDAIAVAHALGIAHRDIKPANIMLPQGLGVLPSRVLDFGIAKVMSREEANGPSGETRTSSSMTAFSAKYAAPEQFGGLRSGPWTDVHALALVLTEMVTGREPYPGQDFMEIAACALRPQRPTPASLGVDVGAWEPVLAKALAFKAPDRFANASEFLAALDGAVPVDVGGGVRSSTSPGRVSLVSPNTSPPMPSSPASSTLASPVQDSLAAISRPPPGPSASRPSRAPLVLAAVLGSVALLIVAGAASLWATQERGAHASTTDARDAAAGAQASREVRVRIANLPAGATVDVEGRDLGTASDFALPRGERPLRVTVHAAGYQPLAFELRPDRDQAVSLPPLVALPQPVQPAQPAPQPEAPQVTAEAPREGRHGGRIRSHRGHGNEPMAGQAAIPAGGEVGTSGVSF